MDTSTDNDHFGEERIEFEKVHLVDACANRRHDHGGMW